jgi:hypothetical protein
MTELAGFFGYVDLFVSLPIDTVDQLDSSSDVYRCSGSEKWEEARGADSRQ